MGELAWCHVHGALEHSQEECEYSTWKGKRHCMQPGANLAAQCEFTEKEVKHMATFRASGTARVRFSDIEVEVDIEEQVYEALGQGSDLDFEDVEVDDVQSY